jgi:isochorismate synthase
MTLATSPAPSEHADREALAVAIERARRADGPSLIRSRQRLPDGEPWSWLDPERAPEATFLAWHEPSADLTFAASGAAAAVSLRGPERMEAAARWCSQMREHLVDLDGPSPAEPRPLILSSLAFSARDPAGHAAPWAAFGDGLLWVPRVLVSAHAGQCWATCHDILRADEPAAAAAARITALRQALARRLSEASAGPAFAAAPPTERERDGWQRLAAEAIAALRGDGSLSKIVLARATAHRAPAGHHFDAMATARALRSRHSGCTVFALGRPGGATFVGATPELLVRVSGRAAETAALAGTAPRGDSPAADAALAEALSAHAKDRREHELVVSAIVDALRPHSPGAVRAAGPHLRSLADVHHLETSIAASLKSPGRLWELVGALHPTPAVGGVPRDAALAWLADHEGMDRGAYAGPIGWVDAAGDGVFHVALRSALLAGDRAIAYAGAGLVSDSCPEDEWAETEHKLRAIRAALCVRPGAAALS